MPFVYHKAQEIALALAKVATYVRRAELKTRLERLAMALLEEVGREHFRAILMNLDAIKGLVEFGKNIYEIESTNVRVILREVDGLDGAVRRLAGMDELPDLESIFSRGVQENNEDENENKERMPSYAPSSPDGIRRSAITEAPARSASHNGNGSNGNGSNGINATIRQSAILDKIQQSGKIALKDVIADFPDVSERTLRYDLHKLCSQDTIERIGNGGPATYYVLRSK